MNERIKIKDMLEQPVFDRLRDWYNIGPVQRATLEEFAELIVEECRNVVTEVYRKTPLELCGPLLTADEEIVKHFYGVEE